MVLISPEHPRREPSFPTISSAQLLMYVGLASLTMLFGSSLVAYFITRAQAQTWRSMVLPALPSGVWLSTVILVLLSASLHLGQSRLRKNAYNGLTRCLWWALALASVFLVVQGLNWRAALSAAFDTQVRTLYVYTFFMLTVLHALHVVAGIVPLVLVYRRSLDQYYSSSRAEGVRLLRQYWDFLLVVWLVLLGALSLS